MFIQLNPNIKKGIASTLLKTDFLDLNRTFAKSSIIKTANNPITGTNILLILSKHVAIPVIINTKIQIMLNQDKINLNNQKSSHLL